MSIGTFTLVKLPQRISTSILCGFLLAVRHPGLIFGITPSFFRFLGYEFSSFLRRLHSDGVIISNIVKPGVCGKSCYHKIFNPVIHFVTIDVMNYLRGLQLSTNLLLHKVSVIYLSVSLGEGNSEIPVAVGPRGTVWISGRSEMTIPFHAAIMFTTQIFSYILPSTVFDFTFFHKDIIQGYHG